MEQVAQMLGVNLDEEFKLKDFKKTFKITKDGMFWYSENVGDWPEWVPANHILLDILLGDYEIEKSILTDEEKKYLRNVIGRFMDSVRFISKIKWDEGEFIRVSLLWRDDVYDFPFFEEGTKYKGMEKGRMYSVEELGL